MCRLCSFSFNFLSRQKLAHVFGLKNAVLLQEQLNNLSYHENNNLILKFFNKKHYFYHKTISGCSKKTKRGSTGSSQMLNYLSRKHENSMQIKERRLNVLEEKKMALEEMKWEMMMSCHANTQNDLCD